jgi:hypothetical protein
VQFFENVFPAAGDHTDAQELIFDIVSFPEEDSQQRGDSGSASTPSNPPEGVPDGSEHVIVAIWRSFALGATGVTIHRWRYERMLERRCARF